MSKENLQTPVTEVSVIEDLTLSETEMANVKGGPSDYLLELDGVKGESKLSSHTLATYDLKAAKK